jgi:hypothetical protein
MDTCAQRYGWENVMYKISWQNLQLMMLDRVESVEKGDDGEQEITAEEIKKGVHITEYLKKRHGG